MKKITKARQKEFLLKCQAMLQSLGCVHIGEKFLRYEYELATICGKLLLSVDPGPTCHTLYTRFHDPDLTCHILYTRFDDPARVDDSWINYNRHSGKWNFHISDNDIDGIVEHMRVQISQLVPKASAKKYNTMMGVGKAKYVVNHHDGQKTHSDGSPFYDIAIFGNKKEFEKYVKKLEEEGYSSTKTAEAKPSCFKPVLLGS